MKQIVEFKLAKGGTVLVEAMDSLPPGSLTKVAAGDGGVVKATQTFEDAIDTVKPAAAAVLESLQDLCPGTIAVEFGINFKANASIGIIGAGSEAAFKVTMTWSKAP